MLAIQVIACETNKQRIRKTQKQNQKEKKKQKATEADRARENILKVRNWKSFELNLDRTVNGNQRDCETESEKFSGVENESL